MKKLLLSLVCIGSILALPGCWCCRKSCERVCEERCNDDYNDYCGKEDYNDGEDNGPRIVERQQGEITKVYHKKGGAAPKGPRKIAFKSVHPVLDEAQAQGKECKLIDPRFHKLNKKTVKQNEMQEAAPKKGAMRKQVAEAMDMD